MTKEELYRRMQIQIRHELKRDPTLDEKNNMMSDVLLMIKVILDEIEFLQIEILKIKDKMK